MGDGESALSQILLFRCPHRLHVWLDLPGVPQLSPGCAPPTSTHARRRRESAASGSIAKEVREIRTRRAEPTQRRITSAGQYCCTEIQGESNASQRGYRSTYQTTRPNRSAKHLEPARQIPCLLDLPAQAPNLIKLQPLRSIVSELKSWVDCSDKKAGQENSCASGTALDTIITRERPVHTASRPHSLQTLKQVSKDPRNSTPSSPCFLSLVQLGKSPPSA